MTEPCVELLAEADKLKPGIFTTPRLPAPKCPPTDAPTSLLPATVPAVRPTLPPALLAISPAVLAAPPTVEPAPPRTPPLPAECPPMPALGGIPEAGLLIPELSSCAASAAAPGCVLPMAWTDAPDMDICVPSFSTTRSKAMPRLDCSWPFSRALASVTCPTIFDPLGITTLPWDRTAWLALACTSSPGLAFLASTDLLLTPPLLGCALLRRAGGGARLRLRSGLPGRN